MPDSAGRESERNDEEADRFEAKTVECDLPGCLSEKVYLFCRLGARLCEDLRTVVDLLRQAMFDVLRQPVDAVETVFKGRKRSFSLDVGR
ncbi:hypothetical protein [Tenggerimyces flavus]|uniref:Uncharacterized protein n=1 Tax=Tenggerimyces flavus TaxID=1708749 RepID=A0ABV7YN44_9ACTN|nr:hypothetical protein [Tenggerimyces flavus]MBM7784902.1 hypothetical protein [Tenggerimyces flavus]